MVDYSYTRGSRELRSRNRSAAGSNLSVREIESTARSTRHAIDTLFNDRPAGVTRNTGAGPARINVDLRAGWAKSFGAKRAPRPGEGMRVVRIGGGDGVPDTSNPGEPQRYRVSLYAQAFNVLNRTNPIAVGTIVGSPLFGRAVVTDPGRRIELGATFAF